MTTLRALAICSAAMALLLPFATGSARAQELRLASWNINNLYHQSGEPLRRHAPARSDSDYDILAGYADMLEADIIGLQEIGSPEAVWRVFSREDYDLYFSQRYLAMPGEHRMSRDIYTAVLVRKGIEVIEVEELDGLEIRVEGYRSPSWTRRGIALLISHGGRELWVVDVHLKSSCHGRSLDPSSDLDCDVLKEQREVLEEWIDRTFAQGTPFVILGDFNRRFDLHRERDHFWSGIDDGNPQGLDLLRLPYGRPSQCGEHAGDHPIDFFVFDTRAWRYVERDSFQEHVYAPEHLVLGERISDHCPISVTLDIP